MSYQLYADDECVACDDYVKEIANDDIWKCEICHMTESTVMPIPWLRYQLNCSHQVHPRCYKKWCHLQEMVGCPTCGLLEMKEEHMYCVYCERFGHKPTVCLYE